MTIRKIVNKIVEGEIRIPAFQRDFVWEPKQIAFLLDSIYKEIPIGAIFLWKTNEILETDKNLGQFLLPQPKKDYPVQYVLDGQQRITSLFTIFQDELKATVPNSEWMDIYFDFEADSEYQDSYFLALNPNEVVSNQHFPMRTLFNSVEYRKQTNELSDEKIRLIDSVQEKFKEYLIPYEEIETEDKEKVAIVFERINRAGTPLDTYQIISAWTWSTDFDLRVEVGKLEDTLDAVNFGKISEDSDLILKCCSGVIKKGASPKDIIALKGSEIRDNFSKIANGIKGAVDFMKKELLIETYDLVPYTSMIVSLTNFFATDKKSGTAIDEIQRIELIKWFWRSCYSRRYTSGVTGNHKKDLQAMEELKKGNLGLANINCNIEPDFFINCQFNVGSVNTKTYICTLASKKPKSLISGAVVDLSMVLSRVNRNEFHHIFPKKFLTGLNKEKNEINCLANLCFLSNADNMRILDKNPKTYKTLIQEQSIENNLKSNLCTADALDLTYTKFLKKRSELLAKYVNDNLLNYGC